MILTKHSVLALSIGSLFLMPSRCNNLKKEDSVYNAQWVRGRSLYLDICTACHIGYFKDTIFADYTASIYSLPVDIKSNYLSQILIDSNHYLLNLPNYSGEQIEDINYYIETPARSGAVP